MPASLSAAWILETLSAAAASAEAARWAGSLAGDAPGAGAEDAACVPGVPARPEAAANKAGSSGAMSSHSDSDGFGLCIGPP